MSLPINSKEEDAPHIRRRQTRGFREGCPLQKSVLTANVLVRPHLIIVEAFGVQRVIPLHETTDIVKNS